MTMRVHFSRSSDSDTFFWVMLSSALGRLVEHQNLGLRRDGAGDHQPLALPAGYAARALRYDRIHAMGIRRMSSAMPVSSAASHASCCDSHGAEITMLE